jgi:hypothetical protein
MIFGCFGYIKTPKQAVSILERNNRNKRLVSDSAETSLFRFLLYRNETSFVGHPSLAAAAPVKPGGAGHQSQVYGTRLQIAGHSVHVRASNDKISFRWHL